MARRLIVEADGGSRGNPGPAASGTVVRDADTGQVLAELAEFLDVVTNNVAEYSGAIAGLKFAHDLDPEAEVEVRLDSKLVVEQMRRLFAAWEDAGLVDLLLTWEGSFAPRFIRGGRPLLSNHAWGTAFDVNFRWNRLATVPALRGDKGSVRELVPIAHEHGFFWGGHFSRCDGMHFEVAQVQ